MSELSLNAVLFATHVVIS